MSHWIIAPVVLPAILAPLIVLAGRRSLLAQRLAGVLGAVALLGIAVGLMVQADSGTVGAYFLGGWPAPFGIVLVVDRLAALMLVLTAVLALVVVGYAICTAWDARGRHFHGLMLFQVMGLNGAFLTGDLFNLFVFFEVLLIASYGLMIHGGGRDRLRAGVQYVAYNLVGSVLFLFALATIYAITGTLNMADLAGKVAALPAGDHALARVALVLLIMVFAIKAALVPFHFWLPLTYGNAPGPVAALFAVLTKVGAYAMIRTLTLIFPGETPATGALAQGLILPAAVLTLGVGAVGILGARQMTRLAAFAAIASIGTVFVALAPLSQKALAAGLYYISHSTLAVAALFLVTDQIVTRRGSDDLRRALPPMAGGGALAALFFAGALAVAGMPPLSGFLGKLMILDAQRGPGMGLVWTVVLATTLVIVLGLARAGSLLFWKAQEAGAVPGARRGSGLSLALVAGLMVLLAGLTIWAGPAMRYMTATAAQLLAPAAYIAANRLPGTAP